MEHAMPRYTERDDEPTTDNPCYRFVKRTAHESMGRWDKPLIRAVRFVCFLLLLCLMASTSGCETLTQRSSERIRAIEPGPDWHVEIPNENVSIVPYGIRQSVADLVVDFVLLTRDATVADDDLVAMSDDANEYLQRWPCPFQAVDTKGESVAIVIDYRHDSSFKYKDEQYNNTYYLPLLRRSAVQRSGDTMYISLAVRYAPVAHSIDGPVQIAWVENVTNDTWCKIHRIEPVDMTVPVSALAGR